MVTDVDLLIIGGGIHGAACAQAASAKGYRVLLLEKNAKPGQETSSKSSKLIHGGLRYLETGQFKLVKECLQERKLLLKNAPQLVKLIPFYIPVYKHTLRSSLAIYTGLLIYSFFSHKPFRTVPEKEWGTLDGLNTKHLKKVFQYYDAQTDDQLLTQAVMKSAEKLGTTFYPNTAFDYATCNDELCEVYFTQDKVQKSITTKLIINTTGPRVNQTLDKIKPRQSMIDIELVLGTHIIIEGKLDKGIYYLESPLDKRAVFVMPWKNKIMIGTTEVHFSDPVDQIAPPESDIDYLLNVYNIYFNKHKTSTDIIEAFSGLRVLPKMAGAAFSRPRDTIIHHNNIEKPRVFTLYGGKLTAYRATAESLMKIIKPLLPATKTRIDTRKLLLKE